MMISKLKKKTSQHRHTAGGFTLIEILIGLALGMLATMVVMQVFTVFEQQRRTSTGESDAQTNGNIAFYTVASDLQMAGYGWMPDNTNSLYQCVATTTGGIAGITGISPVTIVDGVSDEVTIRYAGTYTGGGLVQITQAPVGTTVTIDSNFGCELNSVAFISNGQNCALAAVSEPGVNPDGRQNVTLKDDSAMLAGVAVLNAKFACLGAWIENKYSVASGTLNVGGSPIVADVVNIQAQYGISEQATSNDVTQWVDAVGAWQNPTAGDLKRIKAVRVAFATRNSQRSEAFVSFPCAVGAHGPCAWDAPGAPAFDLSADPEWQHYRYNIFESIIPLRNVIRARPLM